MSNKEQNSNDSNDSSEPALTSVKTVYARAAIILLALNFAFTGYLTYSMNKTQSETLDSMQQTPSPQASVNAARKNGASEPSSPLTVDETIPQTLDK